MSNRKDDLDNINVVLTALPSDIAPLATDLFTRIQTLDAILSDIEDYISRNGPFIETINDEGIVIQSPSPIVSTYNQTINVYNSTVRELLNIKDKYFVEDEPLPKRSKMHKVVSAFIIIASALFAYLQ